MYPTTERRGHYSGPGFALLLADSRLPTGSHAHSNGMEQAVDEGWVHDLPTLEDHLHGRLTTSGTIAAHAAARAWTLTGGTAGTRPEAWLELEAAVDARTPSPAVRTASRRQGSTYLRLGTQLVASPVLGVLAGAASREPHLCVAQGAVAGVCGCSATEAAALGAYAVISGPATAALRLLGLDPTATARLLAAMVPAVDEIATTAAAGGPIPAAGSPLTDLLAEVHAGRKERLFAS